MAPLMTGLAIMPFSTPHLVAMALYSPVDITCSSACLYRLGQPLILLHRPPVRCGVELLPGGCQRTAAALDGEPGDGRVRGHRVDLPVDQSRGQFVLPGIGDALNGWQAGRDALIALGRDLNGFMG